MALLCAEVREKKAYWSWNIISGRLLLDLKHQASVAKAGLSSKKYSSLNWSGNRNPLAMGMRPNVMNGSMECWQILHFIVGGGPSYLKLSAGLPDRCSSASAGGIARVDDWIRQRPLNPQIRIVPQNPGLIIWKIIVGTLVQDFVFLT